MKPFIRMACSRTLEKLVCTNNDFKLHTPDPDLGRILNLKRKDQMASSTKRSTQIFVTCKPHDKHNFFTVGFGWRQLSRSTINFKAILPDFQHSELNSPTGYISDIGDVAPHFGVTLPNHTRGQFRWMPHIELGKQNTFIPVEDWLPIESAIEENWPTCPANFLQNMEIVTDKAAEVTNQIILKYEPMLIDLWGK